jgi:AraC-like DNA-binding protein
MVEGSSISRFQTRLFEEWESQLNSSIGHHTSSLLTPSIPFVSSMEVIRSANLALVQLEGCSSVRLHRHQALDQVVLWLPQSGWVHETVNGCPLLAEPGTAMLCLPGDELLGVTTPVLKGFSLVMPASLLGDPSAWNGFSLRHLAQNPESLAAVQMALEIASTLSTATADVGPLVLSLVDQLFIWRELEVDTVCSRHPGSVERRQLISQARDWIHAHLDHPFQIADLAMVLHVSLRTLQYAFSEELGHSPLVEVRRIRFRRLRQELLKVHTPQEAIEHVFCRCGLLDTPVTTRHYRDWCGETPRQTRSRAGDLSL